MSRHIPWGDIIRGALDLGAIVLGAILADRQRPAEPSKPAPAPQPPRAPDSFPQRADNEITARGHAGIDERFRQAPAPGANQAVPTTIAPSPTRPAPGASVPPPGPLPGSALRGEVPVDPDATEPEVPDAIARRGVL